jgi:L-lactate dehydrogenase complex protein LldF
VGWDASLSFPAAAHEALRDSQLRHNLARATATIRGKRALVVGELPDWEDLRLAGAALKDEALHNLDRYLLQVEERVTTAGGQVHWARDGAEANRIVTGLVQAAGVDEVVKVKSMATMEIDLNEALEAAGIAVWETDLAELIVQLAHDRPSHILVPAIHRNRAEIRELFLRTIPDAPRNLSDEPRELAAAARTYLRRKFLTAKVAISGANFIVTETGTLVVVESEGNGRMCLTLPEQLISVVGIEKVVPTWQDLEVFLQLLPRSSTGERMNPYTSMWTGVTPGDGPRTFHLVLIDNGRTDVLADAVGRQALRCIRCSACLNVCPVYERTGGHAYGSVYPGPIGAILNPQLHGVASARDKSLPYASTLCGRCFEVCPVRIDIPEVLVHLRGTVVDSKRDARLPTPELVAMKSAGYVLGAPSRLAAAERAGSLVGRILGRRGSISRLPGPMDGWTEARDAPAPPAESFRAWWRRRVRAARRVGGRKR